MESLGALPALGCVRSAWHSRFQRVWSAAILCLAQAAFNGQSVAADAPQGQILLFGECAPAINHIVLDEDFLARDSAGNQRLIDSTGLTSLLRFVSTTTRDFSQSWISRAADTQADGFGITDAPCLRMSVGVNGTRRELRWQMVLEPWDEDSLALHELQRKLGALATAQP